MNNQKSDKDSIKICSLCNREVVGRFETTKKKGYPIVYICRECVEKNKRN